MAMRVAIYFDLPKEMKTKLEKRFEPVRTNYGEIFRQCTRLLLELSSDEIKDFLIKTNLFV